MRDTELVQVRQDAHDFFRRPAVRDQHDDVVPPEQAEVAVGSFGGVQEGASRSGAIEGGHQLAGDQARLANAADDDDASTFEDQAQRVDEPVVETCGRTGQRL
jgi:hypothetical protein